MEVGQIKIGSRVRKELGDIQSLANSIQSIGLLHPIIVNSDNELKVGYRRLKACQLLGWQDIPVRVVDNLDDLYLALQAERDENTCRLDFTPSEAVAMGRMLEPYEREAAQKRTTANLPNQSGKFPDWSNGRSRDKVGQAVGMSGRSYQKAKAVVEFVEENPEYSYIQEEMDKKGKINRSYKEVNRITKLQQRQSSQVEIPSDSPVWHGDFREVGQKIPDNSVDLIFTDPPYGQEYLELYKDLSTFANRILKPGGLCLVYSGQGYLPEKINYLGEALEYVWCFAIEHSGQRTPIYYRNVSNVWKPVLAYGKMPLDIWWKTMPDMQTGHQEKDSHEWQQSLSEAEFYIKNLCPPGNSLIVDPFCGSGTTLVAARNLGFRYIGIEEDLEDCQEAIVRLNHNT